MINRSIILLGVVLFMATGCFARKKQDCPRADIKVSYNYHEKFMRSADGPDERDVSKHRGLDEGRRHQERRV